MQYLSSLSRRADLRVGPSVVPGPVGALKLRSGAPTHRAMTLPVVSVLLMTYNHERFVAEAIESVLAQDYPADRLDIVLVDDGSTDGTWERVQPYAGRLRAITKRNGGLLSTANRLMAEARGDIVCYLSCDDLMKPHRVRAAVDVLVRRPEVSLVCSEVDRIDADGRPRGRYIADLGVVPPLADDRGKLMAIQTVCAPSAMFRATMRDACFPIGPPAPWEDWWIYLHAMEEGLLWRMDDTLVSYRQHGANLYNGADAKRFELRRQELPQLRWALTEYELEGIAPMAVMQALAVYLDAIAQVAGQGLGTPAELAPVDDARRAAAAQAAAEAARRFADRDTAAAVKALARAAAHAPDDAGLARQAVDAFASHQRMVAASPAEVRRAVIRGRWGELRRRPWLLEAHAQAFGPADDVSLVIEADGWSLEALERDLGPIAAETGIDAGADVVVLPRELNQDVRCPAALTDDRYVAEALGAPAAGTADALRERVAEALTLA